MSSVPRRLLGLIALALLPAACLQVSVNPLFLHKGTRFEPALVGAWRCGSETWTFARTTEEEMFDGPIYEIEIAQNGAKVTLGAALGRLGEADFMTFWPDSGPDAPNVFYKRHLLPGFSFGRIRIGADTLSLAMLDDDWVHERSKSKRLPKDLRVADGNHALISTPAELQRFARAYMNDTDAFHDMIELVRDRPGSAGGGSCYSEK